MNKGIFNIRYGYKKSHGSYIFDKNTNKIKSITLPDSKYIVKEVSK